MQFYRSVRGAGWTLGAWAWVAILFIATSNRATAQIEEKNYGVPRWVTHRFDSATYERYKGIARIEDAKDGLKTRILSGGVYLAVLDVELAAKWAKLDKKEDKEMAGFAIAGAEARLTAAEKKYDEIVAAEKGGPSPLLKQLKKAIDSTRAAAAKLEKQIDPPTGNKDVDELKKRLKALEVARATDQLRDAADKRRLLDAKVLNSEFESAVDAFINIKNVADDLRAQQDRQGSLITGLQQAVEGLRPAPAAEEVQVVVQSAPRCRVLGVFRR